MPTACRQMHLGVFVLGTGNDMAGWPHDGAFSTHVGPGATVSTSFSEPYNVARVFGSIDHISGGRAGWNVVTSSNPKAALNFNLDEHIEHEQRYARANEFVDVVRGLRDCWDDGAIVADKATGLYVD